MFSIRSCLFAAIMIGLPALIMITGCADDRRSDSGAPRSAYPPNSIEELREVESWQQEQQRAKDALLKRCAADPTCQRRFPRLKQDSGMGAPARRASW